MKYKIQRTDLYVTPQLRRRLLHSSLRNFYLSVHYIQGAEKDRDTFCTVNLNFNLVRQSKAEKFYSLQETFYLLKKNIVLKVTIFFAFHTVGPLEGEEEEQEMLSLLDLYYFVLMSGFRFCNSKNSVHNCVMNTVIQIEVFWDIIPSQLVNSLVLVIVYRVNTFPDEKLLTLLSKILHAFLASDWSVWTMNS